MSRRRVAAALALRIAWMTSTDCHALFPPPRAFYILRSQKKVLLFTHHHLRTFLAIVCVDAIKCFVDDPDMLFLFTVPKPQLHMGGVGGGAAPLQRWVVVETEVGQLPSRRETYKCEQRVGFLTPLFRPPQ